MIELAVIALLCLLVGFQEYNNRKERAKLINAILAKDPQDMVHMTLADQTKVEPVKPEKTMEDLVESSDMSEEQFNNFISQQQ